MKSSIVNESKLTAEERKNMPDKAFGLPEDRAYPIHDEEHIRAAIRFFKWCPGSKRTILANNINKQAKKLGIKIKISKDNPFFRHADKSIVQEVSLASDTYVYESMLITDVPGEDIIGAEADKIFNYLMNAPITSKEQMQEFEKELITKYIPMLGSIFQRYIDARKHLLNPVKIVNRIMRNRYNIFYYYTKMVTFTNNELIYSIFEDLFFAIEHKIYTPGSSIKDELKTIEDLVNHYMCNIFFVQRKFQEAIFECYLSIEERKECNKPPEVIQEVDDIKKELISLSVKIKNSPLTCTTEAISNGAESLIDGCFLRTSNMSLINSENYLNTLKNELKNQINIILLTNNLSIIPSYFDDNKSFLLTEVARDNREIYTILEYLYGSLNKRNIKYFGKDYTLKLTGKDLMVFTSLKKLISNIYMSKDDKGNCIYYGIMPDKLYLLGKNKSIEGEYILVKLFDGQSTGVESNFIINNPSDMKKMSIITVNVKPSQCENKTPLTEGISVDGDGNIQFILKPKKTYMDEYAENHKLLVENSKNKNYEGMKKNLAFLFALINAIERDVIYNKKDNVKEDKKKDATKARTFAINDFKTYLKEVQKTEPSFDFTKYYEDSSYGKTIVNIPHNTILGIKKLFKTIMMG